MASESKSDARVLSYVPTVVDSDVASVANFSEFQVPHLSFHWRVDFKTQTLSGSTTLHVVPNPDKAVAAQLHLDVKGLDITLVEDVSSGSPVALDYKISEFTPFGDHLTVDTTPWASGEASGPFLLKVTYSVGNKGAAICWLEPPQTAGKGCPYLFTQGQACLNRQFFPCQDTPAVRSTYDAVVETSKEFVAVMAANMLNTIEDGVMKGESVEGDDSVHAFRFVMNQSIPVYLIALAVGELRCAEIGPRSKVWSEPCLIEASRKEFEGITEKYIQAGEKLFGPYHWETYDLLVMPPCFPYGGMENPRLTFVTPCLLAGDQSLADVVAHEIAHSWFGNLTTNASWTQFFLNEGFTMYAQRRITTLVHGEAFTALEADIGITLLKEEMEAHGMDHPLTKLVIELTEGVDPDDTYNQTPYEKGYCLLSYLRSLVGSDEAFDNLLRDWAQGHAFSCVTADIFFKEFYAKFPALEAKLTTEEPTVDTWLNTPGWPNFVPDFSAAETLRKPAADILAKWNSEDEAVRASAESENIHELGLYSILHFLDTILEMAAGSLNGGLETLAGMDAAYKFSTHNNAEIRMRWAQIVIKQDFVAGFATISNFLTSQGKMRYTVPLYRMLVKGSDAAKKLAVETYAATKSALHLYVVGILEKVLAPLASSE